MSTSVDVSDSLDEARTRLLRTARALNGAWAAALCAMALLVLASLGLLLVAVTVRPVYVVIWSVLLAATGYNLTRFWPRRAPRAGVLLGKDDRAVLRRLLDPDARLAWPDEVRLVPQPELDLAEGRLQLGAPLLACLSAGDLRRLLLLASRQAAVEDERAVRWAQRVAHGDIARPLVGRRQRLTWATSRLTEVLRARAAALDADLGNWAGACARAAAARSRESAAAQAARDQVVDAWVLLREDCWEPAVARGRRHVAPFTGLRRFLDAAAAAGLLPGGRSWAPASGELLDLVARHEEDVALLLEPRGSRLRPLDWDEHPRAVTLPDWRDQVSAVLDAARRVPEVPADTLDTLLVLAERGERGPGSPSSVLAAAIGLAAVDSSGFRPVWSWPHGTALLDRDGWTLPLESVVAQVLATVRDEVGAAHAFTELRAALDELGIDVHEPLWHHDPRVPSARPVGAFAARQGLAARLVVVTDQALHVFRDPQGARLARLLRPGRPRDVSAELRRRALAVWQGDHTGQVLAVGTQDVRHARLGPATGGLWWRLTLTGTDGTVVLRGRGEGRAEEAWVREWLGDRAGRSWLDAGPTLRRLRDVVGLAGTALGALALGAGVLLTLRPAGAAGALPVWLALGGFAALLLAVVPDAALAVTERARRPRLVEPVVD